MGGREDGRKAGREGRRHVPMGEEKVPLSWTALRRRSRASCGSAQGEQA